jgi:flagellar basal body L-ring protein FlgH
MNRRTLASVAIIVSIVVISTYLIGRQNRPNVSHALRVHDILTVDVDEKDRSRPSEMPSQFRIAVEVAKITADGRLVLEGHSRFQVRHAVWDRTLTGNVAPNSVSDDRTIASAMISDLIVTTRQGEQSR